MTYDNTPLTRAEVEGSGGDVVWLDRERWVLVWLGEDGETCLVTGHPANGDQAAWERSYRRALALSDYDLESERDPDDDDEDAPRVVTDGSIDYRWLVASPHRAGCLDDLDSDREFDIEQAKRRGADDAELARINAEYDEEECGCDAAEWSWWGDYSEAITAATPGAIPVTVWSV